MSLSKKLIVCGSGNREVIFLKPRGIEFGPAFCTASRSSDGPACDVARCPWCAREFETLALVLDTIAANTTSLRPDQSSCLELPDSAFADPRLLSTCPYCAHPLKFNPFLVDTSDAVYKASLCRGLAHCRQTKGNESTLGHLAALAVHLEKTGKPSEATNFRKEHDEMAERL